MLKSWVLSTRRSRIRFREASGKSERFMFYAIVVFVLIVTIVRETMIYREHVKKCDCCQRARAARRQE